MSEEGLSYRDAGVDIDAANRAKGGIAALLRATRTPDTLSDLGSFGGLYRVPAGLRQPVLVASTDGVGTKLKLAFLTGRHDTVGEDLVNHCVNDILVQGARPLFFLDYIGMGKLEPGTVEALVGGIARGCTGNGCALLGGETAEMPDFYAPGEYDLAGTVVGVVEEESILDGTRVRQGDVVLALASSGLHTNGYSLARRVVFERMGLSPDDAFPEESASVAEVLLRVHRSYLKAILSPPRGEGDPRPRPYHRGRPPGEPPARAAGGARRAHRDDELGDAPGLPGAPGGGGASLATRCSGPSTWGWGWLRSSIARTPRRAGAAPRVRGECLDRRRGRVAGERDVILS